jgi:hypothetical protein
MRLLIIISTLCLIAAFPVEAPAYVRSDCMVACTNTLGLSQSMCAARCDSHAGNMSGDNGDSYLDQRQKAADIKAQQAETEHRKIELRERSFQCVAACKEAGKTQAYCDLACTPGVD